MAKLSSNFTGSRLLTLMASFLAGMVALAALNGNIRQSLRDRFHLPYRKVLSTATGDITGEGQLIKVVKIKTQKGLFIEIYSVDASHQGPLVNRFRLPDTRDGYFHFRGQATNLALDDLDGDRVLEILAPSFDEELVAHLNIYKYDAETKSFSWVPSTF